MRERRESIQSRIRKWANSIVRRRMKKMKIAWNVVVGAMLEVAVARSVGFVLALGWSWGNRKRKGSTYILSERLLGLCLR